MSLKNKIKNSDEERIEKINNSGFTLIELLAVIIILGVIMLIAMIVGFFSVLIYVF